jgi:drug/metabolite transporter (DMT)-like permease
VYGGRPVSRLIREVLPVTWCAFAAAVITGGTLFTSNAVAYSHNLPFQMKMALLALAGLNMLAFHFITYRSVGKWDEARGTPSAARFAGGFSIAMWLGIVAFGRWIGFTIGF